jgi:formylglycine-generating enzyme required for sulfatase activity
MRLKIDLEIPKWTRWLAGGIAIGLALGLGAWRVYAAVSVKTNWQPGDTLKSADINSNFQALQDAINALKNPDCPEGYTHDTTSTAFVLCTKGVDQIVKVGTGISAFWVDRYEASVWQNVDGTGAQYGLASGAYPSGFPQNGQYTTPVYALSVAGKMPAAFLTWFQAQQACRLSGKRLPTDEEWLAAATGTSDPGSGDGTGGVCNTSSGGPLNTRGRTACVSRWGAEDMIGNMWELTANWYAGPKGDGAGTDWTVATGVAGYNHDILSNIGGAAYYGGWQSGLPADSVRGGTWNSGTSAGVFAQSVYSSPANWDLDTGFRCVAR